METVRKGLPDPESPRRPTNFEIPNPIPPDLPPLVVSVVDLSTFSRHRRDG